MTLSIIHPTVTSSWVALTSAEWAWCPIFRIIARIILVDWAVVEVPGVWVEEGEVDVPEGQSRQGFLCRNRLYANLWGCVHCSCSPPVCLLSSVLGLYMLDINE
ncbi:hypothetical protein H5410_060939 [Solanum commersonii]|uniref:Uncharacterized protein n=1 Tax=Solanum commersonii TaxID=4109 RepID=A0A9J5W6E0_SOLCO|nr:hypothetical protein H5410_060939 [Solanum commersonii]